MRLKLVALAVLCALPIVQTFSTTTDLSTTPAPHDDTCKTQKNWTRDELCFYINTHDSVCEGGGYLLWSQYVECTESTVARVFTIMAGVIFMLFLFIMISSAADDFFSPNVASIVAHLKISESVAGVTFMAFGNGAPDIFSSIASVLSSPTPKAGLALGELLGAGMFVTSMVVATIVLTSPFEAEAFSTVRDILFYIGTLAFLLFIFLFADKVYLWEPCVYLTVYAIYVITVIIGQQLYKRKRRAQLRLGSFKSQRSAKKTKSMNGHTMASAAVSVGPTINVIPSRDERWPEEESVGGASRASSLHRPSFKGLGAIDRSSVTENGDIKQGVSGTSRASSVRRLSFRPDEVVPTPVTENGEVNVKMGGASRPSSVRRLSFRQYDEVAPTIVTEHGEVNGKVGGASRPSSVRRLSFRQYDEVVPTPVTENGNGKVGGASRPSSVRRLSFKQSDGAVTTVTENGELNGKVGGASRPSSVRRLSFKQFDEVVPSTETCSSDERDEQNEEVGGASRASSRRPSFSFKRFSIFPPSDLPDAFGYEDISLSSEDVVVLHGHVYTGQEARSRAASSVPPPASIETWHMFFVDIYKHLRPLSEAEDWKDANIAEKILAVVKILPMFAFKATIPMSENSWSKAVAIIHAIFAPMTLLFCLQLITVQPVGGVGLWAYALGLSAALVALLVPFTSQKTEPRYYKQVYSYLGFLMAIVWIYFIAAEVVNVVTMIGTVSGLSHEILGLTILAWSNSIGDLIADVSVVKQGFPRMAMAAAIGGPLFNLLLGFGFPFLIATARGRTVTIEFTPIYHVLLLFLVISLLTTLIGLFVQKFYLRRPYAIILILVYVSFLIMVVLTETNVVVWGHGTDE